MEAMQPPSTGRFTPRGNQQTIARMSMIASTRMPCGRFVPLVPCSLRDVRHPFALSVPIRHFRVVTPYFALSSGSMGCTT